MKNSHLGGAEAFYENITLEIDEPNLINLSGDLDFSSYALNYFNVLTIQRITGNLALKLVDMYQFAQSQGLSHTVLAPAEPGMSNDYFSSLSHVVDHSGVIERRIEELAPLYTESKDTRMLVLFPEAYANIIMPNQQKMLIDRLMQMHNLCPNQSIVCANLLTPTYQNLIASHGAFAKVADLNSNFSMIHIESH